MLIKNVEIDGSLFLAPLAGYTDRAFRKVCSSYGASICVTEMVSAEGLARGSDKTEDYLLRFDGEEKLITQIFAPSVDPIERCLPSLLKYNPTIIDINCGCPVPKVVKTGSGSALMKDPKKIYEIVSFLTKNTNIPVSVKFRLGWDSESINYLEFAEQAAKGGASMLTLHTRTRSQGYTGTASFPDLKILSNEYKGSDIKIFASGDIMSPEIALSCMNDYEVDGVMFARGAIGNPFIFKQTKDLIEKGEYSPISISEKVDTILLHLRLMAENTNEPLACREMRKFIGSYLKGEKNTSRVKQTLMSAISIQDYKNALIQLKKN